jgi:hypothetical protein
MRLPQSEAVLRDLFDGLSRHGKVLVVVDQPITIGAMPIAVARDAGCEVWGTPAWVQGVGASAVAGVEGDLNSHWRQR